MRFLFASKESQARIVTTINQIGKAQNTPANYEAFARTGYGKSVIVYRCVSMIAGAAKGIDWVLYQKGKGGDRKEISEHPLLTLLNKPNPMQSRADFIENVVAFYVLDGNSYIEANKGALDGQTLPLELWADRPDKMKIIPGPKGYPAAYQFAANGIERLFKVDMVNMKSDILHWKTFHPLNDWYGMSPLEAAMLSLDQNLAGQRWNLALLQNSATPSGVLQVKVSDANPRGEITDDQYKRMRADFETNYQGIQNTGKPMIIEGGLSWSQMSLNPRDLDYTKGKEVTATDIALAFGVPGELLGLGDKTFNNYREARLALYEETVLPTMDGLKGSLNGWLTPAFGDGLELDYDKDDIEVLQWKREQKYTSLSSANFLTQNEKREAVGHEAAEGWDVFVIGSKVGATPEDFAVTAPTFGPDPNAVDENGDPVDPNKDPNADPTKDPAKDPKKPIKKPKPGKDPNALNPDDEESGKRQGDISDLLAEFGRMPIKSLNLVNQNEKRQSYRHQNLRRKRLAADFDLDLRQDYRELQSELAKVKGHVNDAKLTEYALIKVADDFIATTMKRTIKRHISFTLHDFGDNILRGAKDDGLIKEAKASRKFEDYTKRFAETRSGAAIKSITTTTNKQIRKTVGEWVQTAIVDGDSTPELAHFINLEFEELSKAQATRIARTEVAIASNNGALEAVKDLQIPNMFKEWVSAEDDRVRDGAHDGADHESVDGQEVPIEEKFNVPPDSAMEGPGDTSAPADQVINCRCVLTYRSRN